MALETGLTAVVPEELYEKPFIRRMLDPSTPTIEVDGEKASVKTMSMDGKLFPTVVPQEQADGSFALKQLEPRVAYDLAMETGNFIQFDSDEEADRVSRILSDEAAALREAYKNNQNFLAQGGKGLGDVEFRADVESYVSGDELSRLGLELHRRGLIELKGITKDQNQRIARSGGEILGQYQGTGGGTRPSILGQPYTRDIRSQNPLTKESIMQSPRLAAYVAGVSDFEGRDPDTTFFRPRGQSELAALHELRHGALEYLFDNTDLKNQKYFKNYDIDVEEDIMDMIDNRIIKEQNIPLEMDKVSKLDPKYIGGRDRLETVTKYATEALDKLNVPKPAEQTKPSMLNRLLGMEQGGIMMAQQGQTALPMTEATSAPQGGGPKAANPAAQPSLVPAPQQAPRPGEQDPRDAAVKEVADKMKPQTPPTPMAQPVGGLAAPQQPPAEPVPMMAKGGTPEEKPEGLAVMIGLGAPTPSYEDAAEGNPPPGATKEEVADDQLVLLSEGELVVPANVVRYHGLGTYEGMRREALMGLQDMEQSGQIEYVSGGKEKADKIDDDGGIVKAQAGTYLMTNPQFPGQTISPVYKPLALQAPVAASSRFLSNIPGQQNLQQTGTTTSLGLPTMTQSTTSLNPLMLPTVPSDITGVYAPNVGQYSQFQDGADSGVTPPPTTPTPTDPSTPPNSGRDGGRDDGGTESEGTRTTVGNKSYQLAYDSSTRRPGIQGALMSLGNIDQVKLTDPNTGQSAFMSRDRYNTLKDTEDRASVDSFMNDLFAAQEGVDYQGNRAREVYNAANPVKGFVRGIGAGLGYMDDFGPSRAENQAAAKSLIEAQGGTYGGQSLAEAIALDSGFQRETPAPVFTVDAAGNRVPMDRGTSFPEQAFGAGTVGTPTTPLETTAGFTGPFTQEGPVSAPTVGLAAPTTLPTPGGQVRALQNMDPLSRMYGYDMVPSPEERALAAPVSPARDTFASPEAFRRAESARAQAQGMMTPQTGMVSESVIETANALIGRGVSPDRALQMAQETAITGVVSPAMQRELAPPLEGIVQTSFGPTPGRSSVDLQMRDVGLRQGPSFDDQALGRESTTRPSGFTAAQEQSIREAYDNIGFDDTPSPEQEAANRAAEAAREREQRNAQSYERDGFSPDQAANRAAADAEAQRQTGNPNARAAKDSQGNAVTTTNPDGTKGVVTSGEVSGDKRDDPPARQGPSFDDSSLGKDSGGNEGCFAKGTLIMMDDGTQKPVEDVDIGDEVKLGGFVFATGKFLINNLYNYKGIEVSGSHMVLEDNKWLRVEDSELATLVSEDDTIVYVFGSENRRIVIDDVVFTDYFEVNEQEKLKQVGDSYFTNWKESAKITSESNVEVRNTNDADAPTLAA
jgi:hypothetical protein